MLLGGVIGAGITWTVIKSIEALGPAKSALLIVIAQLAVSYIIQLFGLFGMDREPFSWRKLGGLALCGRWDSYISVGMRKINYLL